MPVQHRPFVLDRPAFDTILIFTGNSLKCKVDEHRAESTAPQLLSTIKQAIETSSYAYDSEKRLLKIPSIRYPHTIDAATRDDVEVTAKLFCLDTTGNGGYVDSALHYLHDVLGTKAVDTFILALQSKDNLASIWKALEKRHSSGSIGRLGVANFTVDELDALCQDQSTVVQPAVNQIHNVTSDMSRIAKERSIELLYNHDVGDILPSKTLNSLLSAQGILDEDKMMGPRWIVKFSVFLKYQNVITDQGYIVSGDVVPLCL